MSHHIRLILLLHNHQPIGNFEDVFEQAYRDSYLPFLDVFERYQDLSITLHTSGPLMEWLDANHPEYLDRVMTLVADGASAVDATPPWPPPPQQLWGCFVATFLLVSAQLR